MRTRKCRRVTTMLVVIALLVCAIPNTAMAQDSQSISDGEELQLSDTGAELDSTEEVGAETTEENQVIEEPDELNGHRDLGEVVYKADDMSLIVGQEEFDLLDGVTASYVLGNSEIELSVSIRDDDSFSIEKQGSYTITYETEHPDLEEPFIFTRKVSVESPKITTLMASVVTADSVSGLLTRISTAQSMASITQLTVVLTSDFVTDYNARTVKVILPGVRADLSIKIVGNNATLMGNNLVHFEIQNTSGAYTFQNMTLQGGASAAALANGGIRANGGTGILTLDTVTLKNLNSAAISGHSELVINNCEFRDITNRAIQRGDDVRITESHFENVNILGDHGSAIAMGTKLSIKRTNMINCAGGSGINGYTSGAIGSSPGTNKELIVDECYFADNVGNRTGGAISLYQYGGTVSITNTYFKGNKCLQENNNADGGAFGIFNNGQTVDYLFDNCVFDQNVARDDAGAIFFESNSYTANLVSGTIKNCTFYKNVAQQYDDNGSGGAIQLSLRCRAYLINNTFYENVNKSQSGVLGAGAAVGNHTAILRSPVASFTNNLFVNNIGTADNYKNVTIGTTGTPAGNIGYDNGSVIPTALTVEDIFGSTDPVLADYGTALSAGKTGSAYETKLKTLMILPRHITPAVPGAEADGSGSQGTTIPSVDARGKDRSTALNDAGAVEITWVKFDANGGSWNSLPAFTLGTNYYSGATTTNFYLTEDVGNNITILDSTNLTKGTETLISWNTQPDGSGATYAINTSVPANEQTLYAIWGAASTAYTVDFDSQGGSSVTSISNIIPGSTITAPTSPTYTGYTFDGWYKEAACNNVWTFGTGGDTVNSDITLYAKWIYNGGGGGTGTTYYIVTFDSKGGSSVASITGISAGSTIAAPTAPTKTGYTFGGWYKDGSTFSDAWNFANDKVNSNITLYAKWTPDDGTSSEKLTVIFESNGGSKVASITGITSGSKISEPKDPTRSGYTFFGWFKDDKTFIDPWIFEEDTVISNITLYAKWAKDDEVQSGTEEPPAAVDTSDKPSEDPNKNTSQSENGFVPFKKGPNTGEDVMKYTIAVVVLFASAGIILYLIRKKEK